MDVVLCRSIVLMLPLQIDTIAADASFSDIERDGTCTTKLPIVGFCTDILNYCYHDVLIYYFFC
jgi:hypothetical protein